MDVADIMNENRKLRDRIVELEQQIEELKAKAAWFDRHLRQVVGNQGEDLVAGWLHALRIFGNSAHDIVAAGNIRLEIKYSRLIGSNDQTPMRRWKWGNILGNKGDKQFDRMILLGETNPEYSHLYLDPKGEYVIFDLSLSEAREVAPRGTLTINSNPSANGRSENRDRLFGRYQIKRAELVRRYGGMAS